MEANGKPAVRAHLPQASRTALTDKLMLTPAEVRLQLVTLVLKGRRIARAHSETYWLQLDADLRFSWWLPHKHPALRAIPGIYRRLRAVPGQAEEQLLFIERLALCAERFEKGHPTDTQPS